MDDILDLRGLSCPIPLIKTRDYLLKIDSVVVLVDELVARDNILKFAKSKNYQAEYTKVGADYQISILKK